MNDALTSLERRLLVQLADGDLPPAGLAPAIGADLPTVLETVHSLRNRGLIARQGFDTCRVTDQDRDLAGRAAGE